MLLSRGPPPHCPLFSTPFTNVAALPTAAHLYNIQALFKRMACTVLTAPLDTEKHTDARLQRLGIKRKKGLLENDTHTRTRSCDIGHFCLTLHVHVVGFTFTCAPAAFLSTPREF